MTLWSSVCVSPARSFCLPARGFSRASRWCLEECRGVRAGCTSSDCREILCRRRFASGCLWHQCCALSGQTAIAPRFVEALLAEEVKGGARVTRFLPAVVESDWKQASVRVVPWQGSGDLAANARANGFVVLPNGTERFVAGESVRVLLR